MCTNRSANLQRPLLLVTLALSGGCVMVLEMLGMRIVAPYLGSSTIVLTSAIAIVMAGLSAGYALGGRIADRHDQPHISLIALVLFASILVLSTALFQDIVPFLSLFLRNLIAGSLLVSAILFGPVALLLGMVTPITAVLLHQKQNDVGSSAGLAFALPTIGSIAGTVLAGFWLIPSFDSFTIAAGVAALLALNGLLLVLAWTDKRKFISIAVPILLITLFVTIGSAAGIVDPFTSSDNMLADFNTPYHRVRVWDMEYQGEPIRVFSDWQSVIYLDPDRTDSLFPGYPEYLRLAEHFLPDFRKTLLVGGAGYAFPRYFLRHYPERSIDVVEIDPALIDVATTYFDFHPNEHFRNFAEDARVYLRRTNETYDVVYMDASSQISITPFQLTTVEAMQDISNVLTDRGILIMNVIGQLSGGDSRFAHAQERTLRSVFPHVLVFPVSSPDDRGNIIFVASKDPSPPNLTSDDPFLAELLSHLVGSDLPADTTLLTDDYAPIEFFGSRSISHCYIFPLSPQCLRTTKPFLFF